MNPCARRESGQIRRRNARSHEHRHARPLRTTSRTSSGEAGSPVAGAGHDDAVGEEELRSLGGLDDRDVRRDRVRAVLLLDVREDQHPFCADRAPVPEQFACARLDHTLVCHVRIHEPFDPDEVSTGRVRDGERLAIRCREHLNAQHETGFALHFPRDCRHGGGDLRADTTLEIRTVVHVLDGQRRESRVPVDSRLGQRLLNQRLDRVGRRRRTRKGAEMQHSDQRARRAEAFTEDRQRILAGSGSESHRLSPGGTTRVASNRMAIIFGACLGAPSGLCRGLHNALMPHSNVPPDYSSIMRPSRRKIPERSRRQ